MLPLYLSVEGLYSYQDKQEIDFTKLTEAGLFGIFGNVGSGKSSILEAISFALYGETERLNKQEKRTYNMLNLKSNAACIVFEFLNFQNRKFRLVAQWKRKKKFEETTTLERLAYEWKNEAWLPLESADGASMTNLTYPNFRRTIIIPQGQFKEFLELKGKERSDMMKEIFNLGRFDLGPKVSNMQRQNNSKLEHIRGALSGFEEVSMEILTEKQNELATTMQELSLLQAQLTALEEKCRKMGEHKKLRLDLALKQSQYNELLLEEPKIKKLEKELQTYESTDKAFRERLADAQRLNKEKEQITLRIEQLSLKKREILSKLDMQEKKWAAIASDYQNIERFKAEAEDLKLLIGIAQNNKEQTILEKRLNDGKPFLHNEQQEEQRLMLAISEKENDLDQLKQKQVDTTSLLALENWYQSNDTIEQQITELRSQIVQHQTDIETITLGFESQGLDIDSWEETLHQREQQQNDRLLDIQQEQTALKVQEKLSEFVVNLHDGTPCPLCGSADHPSPMHIEDLAEKENELRNKQQQISVSLQELKKQASELMRSVTILKQKKQNLELINQTLVETTNRKTLHHKAFIWADFSVADKSGFLAYKEKTSQADKTMRLTDGELKKLRQDLEASKAKVEKYRNSLAEIEQKLMISQSLNRQSEQQLRLLRTEELSAWNETALERRRMETVEKVTFLEEQKNLLSESIQTLKTQLASNNGERTASTEQFQQLAKQLSFRQAELSNLLTEHGFDDIPQVQMILQKNLDGDRIRKSIQEFMVSLNVLASNIAELQKEIAKDEFSEAIYEEKMEAFQGLRKGFEAKIAAAGALEKECARLNVEYSKKEKLMQSYEQLNLRKANLTTLENLFRGAGFVNYVSSIHLQRLCEIANERFHRLTKNNLSLRVNESNDFEVVDYLNNGFSRSVKTLSGGQSFQASLCLALALAENIQALNNADRNFFFIDEGFGTLDAESINTVFETLQYLHRENRIVGVISHVEELKERIPRSVTVVNDAEHGSQVRFN